MCHKRIKLVILWTLFCCSWETLLGQYDDPFCQNVFGGTQQTHSGVIVDWNLGESICTETLISKSGLIISTGFLQNKNNSELLYKNVDSFDLSIKVGPNPIQHNITIASNQEGIVIKNILITNGNGRFIQEIKGDFSGVHFKKIITLNENDSGLIYVFIRFMVGDKINRLKIVKLIKI